MKRWIGAWWVAVVLALGGCNGAEAPAGSGPAEVTDAALGDADEGPVRTTIAVGALVFDATVAGPAGGEPVLLLHGFPQTSHEWGAQITALAAAGYRVVAPDQRGYSAGARPAEVEGYALAALAQDALGMADALGWPRFHLVGHDWGAGVAWTVATTAPARLLSVTAMSVPHLDAFGQALADKASCQYKASSYFDMLVNPLAESVLLVDDGALLRGFYEGLAAETIAHYLAFFQADEAALTGGLNWYRANIEDRQPRGAALGEVTVPTMFLWSDGDSAICRDAAELTAQFVAGPYRFEVLAGVNHWIPELAAERVNALLLAHLGAYPAPRDSAAAPR